MRPVTAGAAPALVREASSTKEAMMKKWSDPAYCDIRLGFEVTAYVFVR
jgi:coenzyme PQQ precursor peptide PqqA